MRALVATDYGPPSRVLSVADIPPPHPGQDEVLVRVEAATLNTLELGLITGRLRDIRPIDHPFVVGMDLAGVVAAVGDNVTDLSMGDPVLGFSPHFGAIAEYVTVHSSCLVRRPDGLDAAHGATIPQSGLTALHLLRAAAPEPGERLLVVGATGGIGMYLIQLAVRAGAEVIATASPETDDYVRGLGARHTLDYTATSVAEATLDIYPQGVDISVDLLNDGLIILGNAAAIRPGGRIVSPFSGPVDCGRGITAHYLGPLRPDVGEMADLARQATEDGLQIEIYATYDLADAAQAVKEFDATHVRGKVVITV